MSLIIFTQDKFYFSPFVLVVSNLKGVCQSRKSAFIVNFEHQSLVRVENRQIFLFCFTLDKFYFLPFKLTSQSTGDVEYADCISVERINHPFNLFTNPSAQAGYDTR